MNWTKGVVYRLRMNLGIFNQHWLLPTSEAMSKSTFHIGNQNLFANICSVLELSKRVKRQSRVSQLLIDTWIPSIRVSAEISIGYWLPLQGFVSCFFKMGQFRPLFCLFSSFSHYNFNNTKLKKHYGELGIQTRGRRMAADETTELWRPPKGFVFCLQTINLISV